MLTKLGTVVDRWTEPAAVGLVAAETQSGSLTAVVPGFQYLPACLHMLPQQSVVSSAALQCRHMFLSLCNNETNVVRRLEMR